MNREVVGQEGIAVERIGPAPLRRADDGRPDGVAEIFQVRPGQWSIVVYAWIPKNGTQDRLFPHYLSGPYEAPRWRVDRHGAEVPDQAFLFHTLEYVREYASKAFPGPVQMGRIEIPSTDYRMFGRRKHRNSDIGDGSD